MLGLLTIIGMCYLVLGLHHIASRTHQGWFAWLVHQFVGAALTVLGLAYLLLELVH